VEISYKKKIKNPVTLAMIKSDKRLSNMYLVRAARLSVQSVKKEEFDLVMAMSEA
jgi:predicted RNA-binding protein with PUA-like domain